MKREHRAQDTCASATEAGIQTLLHLAIELEDDLAHLVALLQEERRLVAVFEVEALLETVQQKAAHVARMQHRTATRRVEASGAWAACQPETALPDSMPVALRLVAASSGQAACADVASRLEALLDVVAELQDVNRGAVARTLGWLDSALDDVRNEPNGTYGANGRRAAATPAALRKVV